MARRFLLSFISIRLRLLPSLYMCPYPCTPQANPEDRRPLIHILERQLKEQAQFHWALALQGPSKPKAPKACTDLTCSCGADLAKSVASNERAGNADAPAQSLSCPNLAKRRTDFGVCPQHPPSQAERTEVSEAMRKPWHTPPPGICRRRAP